MAYSQYSNVYLQSLLDYWYKETVTLTVLFPFLPSGNHALQLHPIYGHRAPMLDQNTPVQLLYSYIGFGKMLLFH
jgi:hypothetical protein